MARILTVDDDAQITAFIQLALEQEGMQVTTLDKGRDVLPRLGEAPGFDLLILDFEMPDLNGIEVLSQMRERGRIHPPVIMLTGTSKHLRELVHLDVAAFITKPFKVPSLIGIVKEILERTAVPALLGAQNGQASPENIARPVLNGCPSRTDNADLGDSPAAGESVDGDLKELIAAAGSAADLIEVGGIGGDAQMLMLSKEYSPLVNMVERIIADAVRRGASDVHFEPQERDLIVRMRFDGVLQAVHRLPARLSAKVAARLKIMANLDISERRLPQDGRFRISIDEIRNTECRVSTLPSLHGEKLVLRLLHQDGAHLSWATVGMKARDQACVEAVLRTPQGIVLATGPTGSGKTTTLYTMLKTLNTEGLNIVTVEDPVEYQLAGITQVAINPDAGLTFERVLRSLLRQDPNVILVGEMRDLETAEIGMRAAVTGHLVLSTLHTNSAAATVARLINIGIKPYLIAAGVRLIIGQRLVRLLCPNCKRASPLVPAEEALLTPEERALIREVYRPFGCRDCRDTGFTGRRPVFEVMDLNSIELRNRVLQGDEDGIFQQAVVEGMTPIRRGAIELVASGDSCPEDAFKVLFTH